MSTKYLLGATLFAGVAMLSTACKPQDSNASLNPSESMAEVRDDSVIEHARKHADATYVCPMHPQIVRGEPGNCPICGMALEEQEVQSDAGSDFGPPIVTVRPETLQNMGARTVLVERSALRQQIETVGSITYDEDRMGHVHPRAAGWVKNCGCVPKAMRSDVTKCCWISIRRKSSMRKKNICWHWRVFQLRVSAARTWSEARAADCAYWMYRIAWWPQ
ncbi:MAG: efflux RND transporter periplasmic adaptor subunit [Candidatus Competibacteraceae bacterium]|nr:efflux RND transporter periplasmic adaptor subunit [Candidatus Competibacteraceae bacterium]